MSNSEQSNEQMVEAVYRYAAEQMRNGTSANEIRNDLVEKGMDTESAALVVSNLIDAKYQAERDAGRKNMLYGALWCIGGTIITVMSYQAAASGSGGGTYVVTWGAIIFGAIQFFRGVGQTANA